MKMVVDKMHMKGHTDPSLAEPDPLPNLSTREERVWSSDIERLVLASPANGGVLIELAVSSVIPT